MCAPFQHSIDYQASNDLSSLARALYRLTTLERFHFFHGTFPKVFGADASTLNVDDASGRQAVHGADRNVVTLLIVQGRQRHASRCSRRLGLHDKGVRGNEEGSEKEDGTGQGHYEIVDRWNARRLMRSKGAEGDFSNALLRIMMATSDLLSLCSMAAFGVLIRNRCSLYSSMLSPSIAAAQAVGVNQKRNDAILDVS